jgi:hypothetical protein
MIRRIAPYFMALFHLQAGLPTLLGLAATLILAACQSDSSGGVEPLSGVEITVTPAELVLGVGARASLAATVTDLEGRPLVGRVVQWFSSAPEIVTISQTGVVTALDVGTASITASSDQEVGFARVVVRLDFRMPLPHTTRWLILTEVGTPSPECPGNEGGLKIDGGRDCTHGGISRYSLDLGDADQWEGSLPGSMRPQVVAAADGIIIDICIQPPTEITCGPNGPFILVEHRGGFRTIYAHLDPTSVALRRKTAVARGQPLGTMGAWGSDAAPWLHFELRFQNRGAAAASVLNQVKLDDRTLAEYPAGDVRLGHTSVQSRTSLVSR